MKLFSSTTVLLLALGGVTAVTAIGCSSESPPSGSSTDGDVASVGLNLTLPGGATLNTVTYTVTGPGGYTQTGSIDVSMSTTISGLFTAPAGGPYTLTVSGTSTDGSANCSGSQTFSVTAHTTTTVPVHLTCHQASTNGSVMVNGSINICPVIDGISASPAEVWVGKTLALTATAHDSDAAPSALSYSWTTTAGGSFSSATAAAPTFTCTTAGTKTITLGVSDGDSACSESSSATVTCSNPPYLVPVVAGVTTTAIFTAGDSVNLKPDGVTPYRMVGIPDGLGAKDNGDGTFTLFSNHEIASGGIARAHGGNGAFVSKWIIKKATLAVQSGQDLIQTVATWNTGTSSYNAPATGQVFSRFCSADLAAVSAFYDAASGTGYNGQFFMNGEETNGDGKAWIHGLDGTTWEFPRMGKAAWENVVANPGTGLTTAVAGTDDTSPLGQVFVYLGTKNNTGTTAIEKAGLTNGTLYGVAVAGFPSEPSLTGIPSGTAFTLASLGNAENMTGAQVEAAAAAGSVTGFQRPEDSAWDPMHPTDLYFVTTQSFTTPSRLWRLRFSDLNNLAAGGTLDMLLDGTEGQKMLDNITVDKKGHVMLQEDIGNQAPLGKVWRYDIATDTLTQIAQHNPDLFTTGAPAFLTQDEEASGIIDAADILGAGWFLVDVQAHYGITGELYEGGQYLAIFDPAAAQ